MSLKYSWRIPARTVFNHSVFEFSSTGYLWGISRSVFFLERFCATKSTNSFCSWYKTTEAKLEKANGKDAVSSSMINHSCWHQFEFFSRSVFWTVKTDLWELLSSYSPLHHQTWVSLDRPLFSLFWEKKKKFPCISEASSNICQICNNYNYST